MADDLLNTLRDRLKDAENDAERLRAAITILEQIDAPTPASRPTKRQSAPQHAEPIAKVIPLGKLIKIVSENPGTTTTGLAKLTAGDQTAILQLLKEAESDGKVLREGQRRATRWTVTNAA